MTHLKIICIDIVFRDFLMIIGTALNHLFFRFFSQLGKEFIENSGFQIELKAPAQVQWVQLLKRIKPEHQRMICLPESKLLLLIIGGLHRAKGGTSLKHEAQQPCHHE